LRVTEDFAHSVVVLKEAKNVKYSDFVAPGQTLVVTAKLKRRDGREAMFDVKGLVDGDQRVSGKLALVRYNLADDDPLREASDRYLIGDLKKSLEKLWPSGARSADPPILDKHPTGASNAISVESR
jgi:3-hydroxyacyl-[acyl-carrier-protein] dehydratase